MPTIRNLSSYIDYFRQIAVHDPDLLHSTVSESGDGPIGSKRFRTWSFDEIASGLNGSMGYPALFLELYETKLSDQGAMDINADRRGAFSIVCTAGKVTEKSKMSAYIAAEAIIMRILQQIWEDHYGDGVDRCEAPFEELKFPEMEIIPIGPIDNFLFGWRCEFGFKFSNPLQLQL